MRLNNSRLVPGAKFENRTFTQYDPNSRSFTQMPFNGYQGAFYASTTWTPPVSGIYEIYCIGGGGGGSSFYGSPGGGGFLNSRFVNLDSSVSYTITIGALGARNTGTGDASAGGNTSFSTDLTARGGGGGRNTNNRTGGSGGSGGGGGMRSDGNGGGPGGYDGSNGATAGAGGPAGTGQLGVAWGLGTNDKIPAGGAGAFVNGGGAHPSSGFGGRYRGIYGFGMGRGGNYGDFVLNWKFATGRGCAGGAGNWYIGSSGDGAAGMVVWRLVDNNTSPYVEFLVVAGGGSGGSSAGGGGGAGSFIDGLISKEVIAPTSVALPITVGAGGAATPTNGNGNPGNASIFSGISATGGGRGTAFGGGTGGTGGSGGGGGVGFSTQSGGASSIGTVVTGSNGYVNIGGNGATGATNSRAGSGGGAGGAGLNGTAGVGPGMAGGLGRSSSITGSATTYATGGNGGWTQTGQSNQPNATANTGNGGNGSADNTTAGSGGSGVVILKYPDTYTATFSAGVTETTATSGGFKTTTVTATSTTSETVTFS